MKNDKIPNKRTKSKHKTKWFCEKILWSLTTYEKKKIEGPGKGKGKLKLSVFFQKKFKDPNTI